MAWEGTEIPKVHQLCTGLEGTSVHVLSLPHVHSSMLWQSKGVRYEDRLR